MINPTGFTPLNTDVVRDEKHCFHCEKTHAFPTPRFRTGDRVVIGPGGYHHQDKIGQVATVLGIHSFLACPCDEIEYLLDIGDGGALESRLELHRDAMAESIAKQIEGGGEPRTD